MPNTDDVDLITAWAALYNAKSGRKTAEYLAKHQIPLRWGKDVYVSSSPPDCNQNNVGACEISINPVLRGNEFDSLDEAGKSARAKTADIAIDLQHEGGGHAMSPYSEDSLYEEYSAYQMEDQVREELNVQGYPQTDPYYDFSGVDPLNESDLVHWFQESEYRRQTYIDKLKLPSYPPNFQ